MSKSWTDKLKERWQLKNAWQVLVVLLVFACTGFTVLFIKKPILNFFADGAGNSTQASILYYILILPLYNVILLIYGFVFGQFDFFWTFEKRFFRRIANLFSRKKK
jgi:Na+-driven multidrug efflux pump